MMGDYRHEEGIKAGTTLGHKITFRTDYFDDPRGQLSGYETAYMSWTLGLTHFITNFISVRSEVRYETAFNATPYDNGTKKNQTTFIIDAIVRF